mgnify:CR=1 FL=1
MPRLAVRFALALVCAAVPVLATTPATTEPLWHFPFDGVDTAAALEGAGQAGGSAELDLDGPRGLLPRPVVVQDTPRGDGAGLRLSASGDRGPALVLPDRSGRLKLHEPGRGMVLAAWIKLAPLRGQPLDRTLVSYTDWPDGGFHVGFDAKRRIRFVFRPASQPNKQWSRKTTQSLPLDRWVHVAVVVRTEAAYSEGIEFYIDGEAAESDLGIAGNPIAPATGPLVVGAGNSGNGAPLNGVIDDLRIYPEPMLGPDLFRDIESVESPLEDLPVIPERWEPMSTADLSPFLPFDMPPYEELVESEKKVFGNWHVYKISQDNRPAWEDAYTTKWMEVYPGKRRAMKQRPIPRPVRQAENWRVRDKMLEVRLAKAIGCDGFIMNHFGHRNTRHVEDMLEAAKRVDSPFRILLAQDVVGWANNPQRMRERHGSPVSYYTDLYKRFGKHPFAFRRHGELVISGFMAEGVTPAQWTAIFDNLRGEGIETYFAPYFLDFGANHEDYAPVTDMMGHWGPTGYQSYRNPSRAAAETHRLHREFLAPIRPQYIRYGAKAFSEAKGSAMLRYSWLRAINDDADWANLCTWNDYSEASEFAPSTGTQYAIYDLTAYYTVWFKTGQRPEIVRDVLYYFHRTQFTDADPSGEPRYEVRRSEAEDIIELLAFLKEPGTLRIEIGGKTYTRQAPAGVTPFQVPLDYGTPTFTLLREGEPVIEMDSAFTVMDKPVRGHDLLYKSGSSTRPVVPMHDLYERYFEGVSRTP